MNAADEVALKPEHGPSSPWAEPARGMPGGPTPLLAAALLIAGAASWRAPVGNAPEEAPPPGPSAEAAPGPVPVAAALPAQEPLVAFPLGDRAVTAQEEALLPWLLESPRKKTLEAARPAPSPRVSEARIVPEPLPERVHHDSLTGLLQYFEGGLLATLSFASTRWSGSGGVPFTILRTVRLNPEAERVKGIELVQASSWKREDAAAQPEPDSRSKLLRAIDEVERTVRERRLTEEEARRVREMRNILGQRMSLQKPLGEKTARHARSIGLAPLLPAGHAAAGSLEEQAIRAVRRLGDMPYVAHLFPPDIAELGRGKPLCRMGGAVCRMPSGEVFSLQPDPVAKLLGWPTIGELAALGIAVFPSPLVFDLDGDGVRTSERRIGFDIDGDGILDRFHDASSRDGVLAFDADRDGIAGESARELFGTGTDLDGDARPDGFSDGFAALRALVAKARRDGRLSGAVSEDGWLGAAELESLERGYGLRMRLGGLNGKAVTLREAGVARVRLSESIPVRIRDVDGQGNDVMRQEGARFERLDGSRGDYEDLWFRAWTPWARLARHPQRASWKPAPKA